MSKHHESIAELFGANAFDDRAMRVRLPQGAYRALRRTIEDGVELDISVAEVIASTMKEWALEKGATHFTHWFQPLTEHSAEKHDAFLQPHPGFGAMLEFSGKELVKGEPDASSFPSGGLRATFEARGYTAWDCSSPAFVREDPGGVTILCIPTSFCSYNGEALDLRTPLLRSMDALNKQTLRVLRALGDFSTKRVLANAGLEQEYFLIDRESFKKRRDLIYTGRTLFGAQPPKGQELDDQYYASIRRRVSEFMADLNTELWKLGVPAKTQHNEAAPSQHEVAVVYDNANVASDHNQIVMTLLSKVAARHNLACLTHEKPFAGMSGSGKHDNWSMNTDTGANLLKPGDTPESTARFLLFFMAVIAAVDEYAPLLRVSCSSASNDLRLGGHEAPPAVVSAFIGDDLLKLLEDVQSGSVGVLNASNKMKLGVKHISAVSQDNTDRNRTSPFAFTGNKFELRMLGASQSASPANTVLNTIIAEKLAQIADRLEDAKDRGTETLQIVRDAYHNHRRVIFNGNNYTEEWRLEAQKRGLPELKTALDAIPYLTLPENIALFERHGVFSRAELESHAAIRVEAYVNTVRIEARTMVELMRLNILPQALRYQAELANQRTALSSAGCISAAVDRQLNAMLSRVSALDESLECLTNALDTAPNAPTYWRDVVRPSMDSLRAASDALERIMPRDMWPLPTYGEMLYYY